MDTLGIKLAFTFAFAFIAATVVGFVPNPVVGSHGFFLTNTAHNMVHLLTAVGFIVVAVLGNTASIVFMKSFGVAYLLVGVSGTFLTGFDSEAMLLGFIQINAMDNLLHFGLGVSILLAGILADGSPRCQQLEA